MHTVMGTFISTTSARLDSIEIKAGQLIFVSDKREIYLDIEAENIARRVPYHSILTVNTENDRIDILDPMEGFYYVLEDNKLWSYINEEWVDITNKDDKEDKINKVIVISSDSTDIEYPSAKAVYTLSLLKEDVANKTTTLSAASTDVEYPSAKAVWDLAATKEDTSNKTTVINENSTNTQYPTAEAVYLGLNTKVNQTEKGAAHGVAELDENGIILRNQLPSFVDDVVEYNSVDDFPVTGDTGKIYVDLTTNKTYRWSGSQYIEISPSLALGETDSTAYRGDRGAIAYAHAVTNKGSQYPMGLYKVQTNTEGHIIAANDVTKADIVDLGIPAQDTTYTAGTNITIDNTNTISAENTEYTAGANIQISPSNVISATDTKYTAGTGINISSNNVISATGGGGSSAKWGNISGTLADQTDLQQALTGLEALATYTAGTGISIDENHVISNTQTSAEWGNISGTLSDQLDLQAALDKKISSENDSIKNIIEVTYAEYKALENAGQLDPYTEYHIAEGSGSGGSGGGQSDIAFIYHTWTTESGNATTGDDLQFGQDVYDCIANEGKYPIVMMNTNDTPTYIYNYYHTNYDGLYSLYSVYYNGAGNGNITFRKQQDVIITPDTASQRGQINVQTVYFTIIFSNGIVSTTRIRLQEAYMYLLPQDNIYPFTPTADYQPATKKYVDDHAGGIVGTDITGISVVSAYPATEEQGVLYIKV